MGRNNGDFREGSFTVEYTGEPLFHGTRQTLSVGDKIGVSSAEPHKGINVPVAWTTTSPVDAAHYGARSQGDGEVNVYAVAPVEPEGLRGAYSGTIHPGTRTINTHFVSKHGFVITGVHND